MDDTLNSALGFVAVGGSTFGLALAAGIKFFGIITDAIKSRMDYKIKEREQKVLESGAIFRNALEYIDRQKEDIQRLREEIGKQRIWFECELENQKSRFESELSMVKEGYETRLKDQDGQIASLKADLPMYKEILETGPAWAQRALKDSGLS